jgi:hypothetical protein
MAEELVTILRYRYVIEEMVMERSEFDKINKISTDPDYADTALFTLGRCSNAEFVDWGWGSEEEFLPFGDGEMREPHGYLVFSGDVTDYSDDCAYVNAEEWEHEFPFEIREITEDIKLLNALQ